MHKFDLETVVYLITKYGFSEVVLQFIDDYLPVSVDIYFYCKTNLSPSVNVYITADSSFGSSADDISALHVAGQVLVFFGSDLSVSSSTIPVMVVPYLKEADLTNCLNCLSVQPLLHIIQQDDLFNELTNYAVINSHTRKDSVLLLYDASYYSLALRVLYSTPSHVRIAQLPTQADLANWTPSNVSSYLSTSSSASLVKVAGGLTVPSDFDITSESTVLLYLGENQDLIAKIQLQFSQHRILPYNPVTNSSEELCKGVQSRQLTARYGGVNRVTDAACIGLILGTMGIGGDIAKAVILRLERLIHTAGKRFYTLVMGRINEAKLGNFPEIDLFCLISNDDIHWIKPKEFQVPVVTPFELELGLGARPWESTLSNDIEQLLRFDINDAVRNVRQKFFAELLQNDDDNLIDDDDTSSNIGHNGIVSCRQNFSTVLTNRKSVQTSGDAFRQRSFRGLLEETPAMQRWGNSAWLPNIIVYRLLSRRRNKRLTFN